MFLTRPRKRRKARIKLLGAVQINNTSFFVCKKNGRVSLEAGHEEKLQRDILQRMIDLWSLFRN